MIPILPQYIPNNPLYPIIVVSIDYSRVRYSCLSPGCCTGPEISRGLGFRGLGFRGLRFWLAVERLSEFLAESALLGLGLFEGLSESLGGPHPATVIYWE